jgi:hypothetical protein
MKQTTQFKEEMKNDLMRVYREVSESHECRSQSCAYEETVRHEAPRFYVDARWALQRISPMLRGDRSQLERISPLMREMYEDLFNVVVRLSQEERYRGKSMTKLLSAAVLEPAPRFYISVGRMAQIWKEKVKIQRKELRSIHDNKS